MLADGGPGHPPGPAAPQTLNPLEQRMHSSTSPSTSRAIRLGVIADDFTGGTDIAGFLVENGLSVIQLSDVPALDAAVDSEAVVISLKSRSCPPEKAVRMSLAALRYLRERGCERFFFKYCSTFDSTARGNIGPVTDALLDELGQDFTVVCPALPVNGRTVYHGYLFVNNVPLNESGMRDHPITPMRDANLMRLMEAQSKGKAANIPAAVVDEGPEAVAAAIKALRSNGARYAVTDALTTAHLFTLGSAALALPLVTGGSGLGAGMATALTQGKTAGNEAAASGKPHNGGKSVVLSGSCSQMTNAQVAVYAAEAPALAVDVARCLENPQKYAEEAAAWVRAHWGKRWAPLVYATAPPEQLKESQGRFGAERASLAVEACFAHLAAVLKDLGADHFIVAGGETSGAVMQSLNVSALRIGPQIAPGVPWVRAAGATGAGDAPLALALKSGNFGDERFFFTAQSFYEAAE